MKALRLRALVLALVSAAALAGAFTSTRAAEADGETFKEAMQAYSEGKLEEALAKLQEYVASNPSDEEVHNLLRVVDEKQFLRVMSERGEHERLMKYLLGKARPSAVEQAADAEALAGKVNDAITNSDFDTRRRAAMELRAYGELAVPLIVPHLGASEAATVVNAMQALRYLGQDGTLALVEVLHSDDARVRAYAAAALGQVADPRASAALQRVVETDTDPAAKERALEALARLKVQGSSAADLYVALGERYYAHDAAVVEGFEATRNVWSWEGNALVRSTVPSYLYAFQLAEECAWDALSLVADHGRGRCLLVRALLAQKVEGDVLTGNGGAAPESLGGTVRLAASQGFAAASHALGACLMNQDWDVAVEVCDVLAMTYGKEDLKGHPLGDALVAPERRVRYASAIACLLMSPKRSGLANADKVADLASRAASERAYRQVLVIDDNDEARAKLVLELGHSKYVAAGEDNGWEGLARAKASPTLDVVVIAAALGDADTTVPSKRHYSSLAVIDELMADARTKGVKVIVRVDATPEAQAEAVQKFFQDKYGDKIAGYIASPVVASAALQTIDAAADQVELNPDRVRANRLAVKAAQALAHTDFSCQSFDLTVAVEPLVEAATGSDSSPELKLAAVQALGNVRTGGGAALVKVLAEGETDEHKAAAATALGRLLSAVDGTPEEVDALIAASSGDGDVAKAALAALGQVKRMTAEQRNKAFADHRLPLRTKTP